MRTKPNTAGFDLRPELTLTVLVPAHNEASTIGDAVESLKMQARPPDRIVVVSDNSTDDTDSIAVAHGAEVFVTQGNTQKKAGALNQALSEILPVATPSDVIMVMDADTVIDPAFIQVAMGELESGDHDAVGGVFFGEPGSGLIGALQRNEYLRYSRDIERHSGRVFVLTGTSSIFRAELMQRIAAERGTAFPGTPGQVYDTASLTEDNELTLAAKTLGARMISPSECRTVTEVMPTWRDLWNQRMRWQRGAVENLLAYGWTRTTVRYWGQQFGMAFGTLALSAYLFMMAIILLSGTFEWILFWIAIGMIFVVERLVTVWRGGWGPRLLAAPLVIELAYDVFIQAVFIRSLFDIVLKRPASWTHVDRSGDGTAPSRGRFSITRIPVQLGLGAAALAAHALSNGAVALAILNSDPFDALVMFVVVNTFVFAGLAILKIVPKRMRPETNRVSPVANDLAVPEVRV